ncbi:N-acetyltransferase [Porcipelethomonas sp.]|mgnify:FL=1|uniref:GNAT family N-acetyltransferase n=1 Tax=Porcipelethomonas sp. TaxID=2981675 RepID=UPI0030796F45
MNKNDYIIRLETPADYRTVENINREAFWNLSVPGANEHYFAHIMRDHADFIHELDFVIEVDGKIIASIMYTKSKLINESGMEKDILSFGPICVLPEYQRMGYGKILIEHSFAKALEMGYDTVVIFGNPDNYVSRGFKSCIRYNVCLEGDIFPTALLVKELREGVLDGQKWYYHESSVIESLNDEEKFKLFDAEFPPKIKAWQPSQEEFFIHSHSVFKNNK